MSSSPDALRRSDDPAAGLVRRAERPELRTGVWTRLGDTSVLGDDITEVTLGALAERTRTAARAQGYAVGWAEGRREALREAAEAAEVAEVANAEVERGRQAEHRTAVLGLAVAAEELETALQAVCTQVAEQATGLAFEVVRELVARELSVAADPGADVVRRVLAVLPTTTHTVVRLHPDAGVSAAVAELTDLGVRVVADPTLEPGDALVETDDAVVDLRVSTALERLREVLR